MSKDSVTVTQAATPEQIAMAESIVRRHYPEMKAGYRGRRFQIALAAIIETTERAAVLLDGYADSYATMARISTDKDDYSRCRSVEEDIKQNMAGGLRCGLHLKGPEQ